MMLDESKFDDLILLINKIGNERERRLLLGCASKVCGFGGGSKIKRLTGMSLVTIATGRKEAEELLSGTQNDGESAPDKGKIRRPGGGRKKIQFHFPRLTAALQKIIDVYSYGSPTKVLHWVASNLSLRKMQKILADDYEMKISYVKVDQLLSDMGYSKLANQKMEQCGIPSPYRDEQFRFIAKTSEEFLSRGDPVISIDTKKKEIIGNFKNSGSEWRKSKDPRSVLDHDFLIPELGKVAPYGVYVVNNNTAFVNLGTDHDTAEFAETSVLRWWNVAGRNSFPNAKRIYITCDGGGSNGSRCRLWKWSLQKLANETGMEIMVSHFPPGTSKWNKVEHRLFCYISRNWEGKPLIDIDTVVEYISSTTTETGLKVICKVDDGKYPTGKKITDEEMATLNLTPCETLGKWNYVVKPQI